MSQYNIVGCGIVAPDHGIIGYLTGAEVFMEVMERWQYGMEGCVVNVSKAALEYLATGEGEGGEQLASVFADSLCEKFKHEIMPRADVARLNEFLKAVSKEYRQWQFNHSIESDFREDEYTEGMCIIHNLYKEGQGGSEISTVMVHYFADRLSRAMLRSLEVAYREPLTVFMKRHPKEFAGAVVKVQLVQGVSRFGMLLKMED